MHPTKTERHLASIPANRRLVGQLYAAGVLTRQGRDEALELLYPQGRWGVWVSRLMLAFGAALVLSGIVYFFAFNWAKIDGLTKLISIQLALIVCVAAAVFRSLQSLTGQVLLLSASVLVGVFMAVFGQVYQTGADAYQLFLVWSLLTLGWTVLSNFAPQWIFWLVISNLFLVLWWDQAALPAKEAYYLIYIYLAALNGSALFLRDSFAAKPAFSWLAGRWTRVVLVLATLGILLIPVVALIVEAERASFSLVLSGLIGLLGHGLAFYVYRFKRQDLWALAVVVLSGCIMAETLGIKLLFDGSSRFEAGLFLVMGLITLGVFGGAIQYLRRVAKKMEAAYV